MDPESPGTELSHQGAYLKDLFKFRGPRKDWLIQQSVQCGPAGRDSVVETSVEGEVSAGLQLVCSVALPLFNICWMKCAILLGGS